MSQPEELKKYDHVDLLFPSKYLKAADLRGQHVTVTIEHITPRDELQMKGGKKEKKPVVTLRGKEKKWVLNKTNAQAIAKVHGAKPSKWVGQVVVLYPTKAMFGGDEVDALRVDVDATLTAIGKNGVARTAESKPSNEPAEREPGQD
jgi:hypothetical protein